MFVIFWWSLQWCCQFSCSLAVSLVQGVLLSIVKHDRHQKKSPRGEKDSLVLFPQQNGILMTRAWNALSALKMWVNRREAKAVVTNVPWNLTCTWNKIPNECVKCVCVYWGQLFVFTFFRENISGEKVWGLAGKGIPVLVSIPEQNEDQSSERGCERQNGRNTT